MTIYYEARGESIAGQQAVAEVVLNRTKQRDKSVCEVVFEPNQFSWTKHTRKPPPNNAAWQTAKMIAEEQLLTQTNNAKGATYFHVGNKARFNKRLKAKIGAHAFY